MPEAVTVVGVPGRAIPRLTENVGGKFSPYGTPIGDIPDPVARALEGLMDQVTILKARVDELESQPPAQNESLESSTFVDGLPPKPNRPKI